LTWCTRKKPCGECNPCRKRANYRRVGGAVKSWLLWSMTQNKQTMIHGVMRREPCAYWRRPLYVLHLIGLYGWRFCWKERAEIRRNILRDGREPLTIYLERVRRAGKWPNE
jgi:hypothetical protein